MKREELIDYLRKRCDRIALNRNQFLSVSDICEKEFGVPLSDTMDVISDRVSLYQKSDDFLFFISYSLSKNFPDFNLLNYFSIEEVNEFKKKKYNVVGDYVLRIPCIAIEPNRQWIGSADATLFLKLDRDGKINYNHEKQRVRQRVIRDGEIYFKTKINIKSINQIAKLMLNGEYVSDYLTLDIPYENDKNIYRYDETKKELIFDNLDSFDITDGFHRLEAMKRCYEKDNRFNYPMGIQITQFSLQRTQQFIYQSDQKNKMSVVQSNSFDSLRPSNEVCNFLNEDSGCIFNKMIKRSGNNTVDYVALSDIIEYYWFGNGASEKDKKRKDFDRTEILNATKEVKELLNTYATENPEVIGKYIGFQELLLYFYYIKDKKMSPTQAANKTIKNIKNGKIKEITLRGLRKPLFDQIEAIHFA